MRRDFAATSPTPLLGWKYELILQALHCCELRVNGVS
jgi:hypothetical protein